MAIIRQIDAVEGDSGLNGFVYIMHVYVHVTSSLLVCQLVGGREQWKQASSIPKSTDS